MIQIKRVYDKPERRDGLRVLVERLWPRGLTKQKARVDVWLKDIAPSHELRRWYGHDPDKWPEFQRRYRAELRENKEALQTLKQMVADQAVTLLFSARDPERNSAVVLHRVLQGRHRKRLS